MEVRATDRTLPSRDLLTLAALKQKTRYRRSYEFFQNTPDVSEHGPADDAHAPRPLTFAENIILTFKVLASVGLLGVALWAANLWITAK